MEDMLFAICDCNNFYASCERVFRPDLLSRPIAVLSNNDGCVIARSSEVKALGVPMGSPFFREEGLFRHFGVETFSSNYALYEDMSRRVMLTLRSMVPDVEVYSIDEAFLVLDCISRTREDAEDLCSSIRDRVNRWTGIPVSIGAGGTKTLAKAANRAAKTDPSLGGVFIMPEGEDADLHLESIEIGDVWGVGFRNAPRFRRYGIRNAKNLKYADEDWLKRRFTINEARTSLELRGVACFPFQQARGTRKSIRVSRSFGEPVTEMHLLREAVSCFVSAAAETLRNEGSAAGKLHLFITTNPFAGEPGYANAAAAHFDTPTSFTPDITREALSCLDRIFAGGYAYKKAGIALTDIADASGIQGHLFSGGRTPRETSLMKAVDLINSELGRGSLFTASMGIEGRRSWAMRRERVSPRYTTRWEDIPLVSPFPGEGSP
jgi:DNA polymerase V